MNSIKKVINTIFLILLVLCFAVTAIIVLIQLVSVITLNGALAVAAKSMVTRTASIVGAIACLLGFFSSYLPESKADTKR